LEHDREPRRILSRALDTTSVPKASQPWAATLKARLEAASQLAKTVSTFDRDHRQHVASLPKQARRAPPKLSVGDSVYYRVERFSRDTADGMKLVPTWTGPFVVRCPVAGSQHRYLIARTETSATFDAHIVRLKPAPARTYGAVALESHAADGQGAGRGLHEMDSALVHEIDCIVELGKQGALVRFLGNEINDRWVSLEEMERQGLSDLLADYRDGTFTLERNAEGRKQFSLPASAVARLESQRTHDSFGRRKWLAKDGWEEQCDVCDKDGVKSNPLLCCSFCPRALHYQCAGMELRQRAPAGLWQCPACRRAEDGARVLDAVPPRRQRPERLRANVHNTTLVPGEQPPQLLLAAPAALPVVSAASAVLPAAAASVQLEARPVVIPLLSSRVPTVAARPAAADVTRPALKRPATVGAADEGPRTRRRIEKTGEPLASGVNVVATVWDDFLPPAAGGPQPRSSGVRWIDRGYGTFRPCGGNVAAHATWRANPESAVRCWWSAYRTSVQE
jgi:hypothetical protein